MIQPGLPGVTFRPATASDAGDVTALFLAARREAMPWLPELHSEGETADFIAEHVIPGTTVTVAVDRSGIVGFIASVPGWVEHLYIHPGAQRRGIGGALLERAKATAPDGLRLYAFRDNTRAVAFYRAHGFVVVREGDGSGNEEGMPDVLMAWEPLR